MNDKEILDAIHVNLHAVRLLPKYVPSEFEKKIAVMISDKYSESCEECKARLVILKNPPAKKNFLTKLGESFEK